MSESKHPGQRRWRRIAAPYARLRPQARESASPSNPQGRPGAPSEPATSIAIKRLSIILGVLLTLSFLLGWLAQSVLSVGQREDYYLGSFQKYKVWETAGISEFDAARIARALPKYLTGDAQALSLDIEVEGKAQPAFHADELAHMQDVYGLFVLAERLLLCCACCFAVLVTILLQRRSQWDLRRFWRAVLWTVAGALVCSTSLAVWAAVDFSSLFVLFHRLFFTNDLWQMNPATDLMIRLMPEGMFFDGALSIGLWFLAGLLVYLVAAWAFAHLPCKAKEETTP